MERDLGFTKKQRIFIDEYLKTWNAAGSARKAGYSERSIYEIAANLLTNVNIRAEIDKRLENSRMSSEEVLHEIADIARGDIGQFLDNNLLVDLTKGGNTKLIKKIKQKTIQGEDKEIHDIEIELYDKLSALEKIGKYHKLFKDQLEHTGEIETRVIIEYDNSKATPATPSTDTSKE